MILLAAVAAQAQLTPEQLIAVRRVADLRWSPDGHAVSFTVTEPPSGTTPTRHVWLMTDSARQYTYSAKSEDHARWSPDGTRLAFLSDRDQASQIYIMPVTGGEAIALTKGKRAVQSFEWSPDGKQIAFLGADPKSDAEQKREDDKDDGHPVDRDQDRSHLWMADVATGALRSVLGAPWAVSEIQWLPGGDALVVVATDHPESDRNTDRIFVVKAFDGTMRLLSAPAGPFNRLQVSPDGKHLAFVGARGDGPQAHDLFIIPTDGGTPRNLTDASIDRPIATYAWRRDGTLLVSASEGFDTGVWTVDTLGKSARVQLTKMKLGDMALASTGTIAFVGENATRPPELWTWDGTATPRSVSHLNAAFEHLALIKPTPVTYRSFDGRDIDAALLTPAGGTHLPTIVLVHGGPTGNWSDQLDSWGQLLVAAGYAVFYPNIRGSTGYGYDFSVRNRADWGGGDFKDIMAGVNYLIQRGIADSTRLGIAGWSYGGYMAEWAITQTTRFKAAVSGAGLSDLAAEYGTEDHPAYDEWFYGLPYEKPEGFRRSSPITYIKNARTPTLILQGENDVIDPLGQSQELYRGLKRYGVTTELVVYPREGHGFREEKHLTDRLRRIVAWFDKFMGSHPAAAAAP
ncbi:MAG TPA: S9 family peptidase [Gemmatimonadaceae bacterium]|nr:S9 family peptidase [Gemmatimonadaceae bacterium]